MKPSKNILKALAVLVLVSINQTMPTAFAEIKSTEKHVQTKTVQQISDQILDAYGGAAKVIEVNKTAYRSKGKVNVNSIISGASNSFDCDLLNRDDKLRMEMPFLGQPMITGYDGKIGWTQFGDWVSASTDTATKRIADELKHGLSALIGLTEKESKVELLNSKVVQNKLCDGIKVTSAQGDTTSFYADPNTHLVLRSEFMGSDQEQGVPALQAIEYFDYRLIDGVMTPFRLTEYCGDKLISETILASVEVTKEAPDTLFQMPRETEIAQLKQGAVIIPFEYIGNEIMINVGVNNGKEYKFIVDTGASQSVIDKSVAQTLGPYTVSTFSVTAGSRAVPLSYTKLSSMTLGSITLSDIPALVSDLSAFSAAVGEKPAGLIGANILRRFLVTINYDQKKLILADPHQVEVPEGAFVIPTSPVFGASALVVSGKLNNKTNLNFLVDTGAAFNNLPKSLAKPYSAGSILPVGQIYGLDGQKIDIGSVKLNTLKLGSLTIQDPVFAISPDQVNGAAATGLFSAGAMGILGNPLWSQFNLTIDYRNERLILALAKEKEKVMAVSNKINEIDRKYLMSKDFTQAVSEYEKVRKDSQEQGDKSGEALAMARQAACYVDKYNKTHTLQFAEQAAQIYQQASTLAAQGQNKEIEGRVLAAWAFLYLEAPRNAQDIIAAQMLIAKAVSKAPMEASIYAAFGEVMLKMKKNDLAKKFIDQALMLDPSNWQALWSKYRLCENSGTGQEKKLVMAQLEQYYPGFPDVELMQKLNSIKSTPATSGQAKSAQPKTKSAPAKSKKRN